MLRAYLNGAAAGGGAATTPLTDVSDAQRMLRQRGSGSGSLPLLPPPAPPRLGSGASRHAALRRLAGAGAGAAAGPAATAAAAGAAGAESDPFMAGLSAYLKARAFNSTTYTYLWGAMRQSTGRPIDVRRVSPADCAANCAADSTGTRALHLSQTEEQSDMRALGAPRRGVAAAAAAHV
jgi:hypothetical protein